MCLVFVSLNFVLVFVILAHQVKITENASLNKSKSMFLLVLSN